MPGPPLYDCTGSPGDAGFRHGRALGDLLAPAFVEAYLSRLHEAIGFDRVSLEADAIAWLAALPLHIAEEAEGMAAGAGVPLSRVAAFLYADIAPRAAGPSREESPIGPMCSALVGGLGDGRLWVGRNCDWLTPTLMRGTAAVWHARPNRIPILAVGIRGDIDVDTGVNAEGLWLHLHTLHDPRPVVDERPRISWLFWAREALETCADLDELESFIAATRRDRGVMVVAVDGRRGEGAVFECGTGSHRRHDASGSAAADGATDGVNRAGFVCATNHALDRPTRSTPNPSGTISRLHTLRAAVAAAPPAAGPGDLIGLLSMPGVEMREPPWIRTIYSAVASPETNGLWFAAGTASGTPAASGGRWSRVRLPW